MSKYNKLKKQIFEHDWFMSNSIEYCEKIVFSIAKLELENSKHLNTKVIKNVFAKKGIYKNWIVGLVVEDTNKIGKYINNTRYLEIIQLSYFCNDLIVTHINIMNSYNLDEIKSIM